MDRYGVISGLRAMLLGGAAGLCFAAGPAGAEPDACVTIANVATCSGNQSDGIDEGIDFDSPTVDTLIIENLTQDIGSLNGNGDGVRSATPSNTAPITVISDTGQFAIRAQASGFNLFSAQGQNVSLDHTGDIFAGSGISAASTAFAGTAEAGDISVVMNGDIVAGSAGISAASRKVGDDGNSGNVDVFFDGNMSASSGISVLSSVTNNGNSGSVEFESTGNIQGRLLAESIVGGNGDAGDVLLFHNGTQSGGITATSRVGGDGNADFARVFLNGTIDGSIVAESVVEGAGSSDGVLVQTGADIISVSTAITARSLGSAGQGLVEVDIFERVIGATAAVEIEGGDNNRVHIQASGAVLSPGRAIIGGDEIERVDNEGLVDGNVSLGAGDNRFNNQFGATFNTGAIADLGVTGFLNNAGLVSIGGSSSAPVTTALTGDFTQDGSGFLAVDIAAGGADRLDVSGIADLSGTVRATANGVFAQTQQFTILTAAGGVIDNGIEVEDSLIFDFELIANANDLILQVTADFTPAGAVLTPNQQATADFLDDALAAGGGTLGAVFAHLGNQLDAASFAAALDRLHPEPYLAQTQSLLFSSLGFADGMMSCDATVSRFLSEGECAWVRVGGRHLDTDRTAENIGVDEDTWSAAAGAQKEVAPDRFVSFAAGYEDSDLGVDDRAVADGHIFHAGAAYKLVHGNWLVTGALTGGYAQFDTTRLDIIPGVNADGDARYGFASARLRAAYLFERESLHIKPMIDMDATAIRRNSFHEEGGEGAGLEIESNTDVLLSLAPAVEIGGEFHPTESSVLRPFIRAGVRAFSDDDLSISAVSYSLPDLEPLTVTTPLDQIMGQVSTGIDFVSGDRFDARASYDGMIGERTIQYAGNVKLRMKF